MEKEPVTPLTEALVPILPEEKRVEVFTLPNWDSPVTFNPERAPKPVIDPPTLTLPEVERVEAEMLVAFTFPSWDSPVTLMLVNDPKGEVTDPPTPTFPVVPRVFKVLAPETLRVEREVVELGTIKDPPTLTLPTTFKLPPIPT